MSARMRQAIVERVDARHAEQTALLAELVKIPSDNPPGDCAPHAEAAAGLLRRLGFDVETHPVPAAEVRGNGMLSVTNLIVRQRFGAGPTVALNAHGDVVPPGAGSTAEPYGAAIEAGWMYGRGAAVSKSDFATYAFALLALKAAGARLDGSIELHLTYDEEVGGGIGPAWLLRQGLSRPDYAVSAGFSYAVVTAHNGCLHLEIQLRGKSAHAAEPASGDDALEAAAAVLAALYAHRRGYGAIRSGVPGIGSPSLVVGLIRGGINTNVVPDLVTFRLDRRLIPEEDGERVERDLRDVVAGALAAFPAIEHQATRILLAAPFAPVSGSERLAGIFAENATRVMGEAVATTGIPLYTDARHYAAAGIPTIGYGAGPRTLAEANAHRADEKLNLEDLRKATQVVALSLFDLLGNET